MTTSLASPQLLPLADSPCWLAVFSLLARLLLCLVLACCVAAAAASSAASAASPAIHTWAQLGANTLRQAKNSLRNGARALLRLVAQQRGLTSLRHVTKRKLCARSRRSTAHRGPM